MFGSAIKLFFKNDGHIASPINKNYVNFVDGHINNISYKPLNFPLMANYLFQA